MINYNRKDFDSIREQLIDYASTTYGVTFSPASVDLLLVDLLAGVGDMLSYNTEKKYRETQLQYAEELDSLLGLARTYGLKIPNNRASVTVCDFSITVPVLGDTYNELYTPILKMGTQVVGGGQIFELQDDVDFNSDFSINGVPNRIIRPNIDINENILSYTIIKQEILISGYTKIGRKLITPQDRKPFLSIVIPETNVISVDQVIQMETLPSNVNPTNNDFYNNDIRFFEVDSLVEDKIYVDDVDVNIIGSQYKKGKYIDITKKFITEYLDNGYLKLTFGGGVRNDLFLNSITNNVNIGNFDLIKGFINNNNALGEIPKEGETIYYKYRVGGGSESNIGQDVLNNLNSFELHYEGADINIKNEVTKSLRVNNPIPAIGGGNRPSVEYIRKMIAYNFASQNRCVTTRDYMSRIFQIPGKYGTPFRASVRENNNKIVISILTLGADGTLKNTSNNIIKENIAEYLSKYRMFNDMIEIEDGRIINLSFECDILIDKSFNRSEVNRNVINTITSFMDISKHEMNQSIYLSNLIEKINNVMGVINVIDIRIYNKVASLAHPSYSSNETSMEYENQETRLIKLIDGTLYGENNGMFEIKYPNKDIIIRNKII